MIKKVDVSKLKIGMYISNFDRPWLETPFLFNKLLIKDDKQIEKVKKSCSYVYIDTEKGLDVKESESLTDIDKKVEYEMKETIQEALKREPPPEDKVAFHEELKEAKKVHKETKDVIKNVMEDARMGKSISSGDAKKVVDDMTESIMRNRDALLCLTQLKKRDEYTSFHSINVCVLCLAFGRHMGYQKNELRDIGIGALLHDIGKMKIPDEILNKAGSLTEEEFKIMKRHVIYSAEILSSSHGISPRALDIPLQHHERYNGSGYPKGLKGDEISILGLISSITDVYDAITSNRIYHNGMQSHEALKKMYEWRGKDFHPIFLERFIQCVGIYPFGTLIELDNSDIGIIISINRIHILRPKVLVILNSDNKPIKEQKVVDLTEKTPDNKNYKLSIKNILDPVALNIDTQEYLKGKGLLYASSS
jgi:HD-GYP domain-containing protein (c-di-GMP phosphodiesterase class II)